jgi:hypothetical protein
VVRFSYLGKINLGSAGQFTNQSFKYNTQKFYFSMVGRL